MTDVVRSFDGERIAIDGLRLTPVGVALSYRRRKGATRTLLCRNVDTGDEKIVFQFPAEGSTASWAFSHDGRRLAMQRTRSTRSVVLLRNFR